MLWIWTFFARAYFEQIKNTALSIDDKSSTVDCLLPTVFFRVFNFEENLQVSAFYTVPAVHFSIYPSAINRGLIYQLNQSQFVHFHFFPSWQKKVKLVIDKNSHSLRGFPDCQSLEPSIETLKLSKNRLRNEFEILERFNVLWLHFLSGMGRKRLLRDQGTVAPENRVL